MKLFILLLFGHGSSIAQSLDSVHFKFPVGTIKKIFSKDFAILYFDKPGIGLSTGAWYKEDFFMQAQNAIPAVRFAKKYFAIDTSNIFAIGHSQGGWHTQIVASRYANEIRGGISLAGPATSVFEQDAQTYISEYLCQGLDSNIALQKAVLKTYEEHSIPVSDTSINRDRLHSRIIQGYEPWNVISGIKIPIIPGADHSFRVIGKCYTGSKKTLLFSEKLNEELRKWLLQLINKK